MYKRVCVYIKINQINYTLHLFSILSGASMEQVHSATSISATSTPIGLCHLHENERGVTTGSVSSFSTLQEEPRTEGQTTSNMT